jgi:hypothetical protein
MKVLTNLVATVVESLDHDEMPIFAVPTLNSTTEYNTLEKAMNAIQAMVPTQQIAWIYGNESGCWNAFLIEVADSEVERKFRVLRPVPAFPKLEELER